MNDITQNTFWHSAVCNLCNRENIAVRWEKKGKLFLLLLKNLPIKIMILIMNRTNVSEMMHYLSTQHKLSKHSPVRIKSEDSIMAESGTSTISTPLFSNFCVQEFRSHQTCKDLKAEINDYKMQVRSNIAGKDTVAQ